MSLLQVLYLQIRALYEKDWMNASGSTALMSDLCEEYGAMRMDR
jgi:hypothetical protein